MVTLVDAASSTRIYSAVPDYLEKLVDKLSESAERVQNGADADSVHKLRTTLRRLEAFADAKLPVKYGKVRKQAGTVRDLDVLGELVEKLDLKKHGVEHTDSLRKHIRVQREDQAVKLAVHVHDIDIAQLRRWAEERCDFKPLRRKQLFREFRAVAEDKGLANLSAHNLHDFRLKIKPLRYRAENPKRESQLRPLREMLREMQALIGDWHDRMLLKDLAEQVLKGKNSSVVRALRSELQRSYEQCIGNVLKLRRTLLMPAVKKGRKAA